MRPRTRSGRPPAPVVEHAALRVEDGPQAPRADPACICVVRWSRRAQESMAPKAAKAPVQSATQQMATAHAAVKASKKGMSMPQQYARIMQNQGYFAPWSRQNTWTNRIAINNIRKANTPEVRCLPARGDAGGFCARCAALPPAWRL